jgi:hypothetical protein
MLVHFVRLIIAAIAISASLVASVTQAAIQRTFVASYGNDANACTLPLPCRTFNIAIANTLPGGELIILDSAGYGGTTVSQSVSIIAPDGVYAGVTVGATGGLVINGANIQVLLKGLSINYISGTAKAIDIQQANTVRLENVQITGFLSSGSGVSIDYQSSTPNSRLLLKNVTVRNGDTGIRADGGTQAKSVLAENLLIEVMDKGFVITDAVELMLRDSTLWHINTGIDARNLAGSGNGVGVKLDRTNMSRMTTGILAINGSTRTMDVVVADSMMNRFTNTIKMTMTGGGVALRVIRSTLNQAGQHIDIDGLGGYANVLVANSEMNGGNGGIRMNGAFGNVNLQESRLAQIFGDALSLTGTATQSAQTVIMRSAFVNNTRGIVLGDRGNVKLKDSMVIYNANGGVIRLPGAVSTLVQSVGDNVVEANGYGTMPPTPDTTPDNVINSW